MKILYIKDYNQFINLVWVFLIAVIWLLYIPICSVAEGGFLSITIVACAYPFTTYLSRNLLGKAISRKKMRLFISHFLIVTAIIALLITFIPYVFLLLEKSGFFTPSELIIDELSFPREYINSFLVALLVNFGFCGLRFYEINLMLQKELIESKLNTLQGQITPHFMFNILNHIHVLMNSNVELASYLLVRYSDILRYQLYNAKADLVPLEQEIAFLNNFIDVEMIRWEDNIKVNHSWRIEDSNKKIAPLILITFIENAFKHVPRDDFEKGVINIKFNQQGNIISLEVQNSKSAVPPKENNNGGFGLFTTKKRLDILYPGKYDLFVKETETTYNAKLVLTVE